MSSRPDPTRTSDVDVLEWFESTGVAMALADPADGRIVRVNSSFTTLLGRPGAQLLSRPLLDFAHPEDCHALEAEFERLAAGEVTEVLIEKRMLRPDGSPAWAMMNVSMVRDSAGRPRHAIAALVDIDARKREAEAAMVQREERLRMALDAAGLGLWEWILDTGELIYSDEVLRITGLTREQLAGDPACARRLVDPRDVEVIWESEDAARHARPFHAEYRIVRPDGQLRWVASHAQTECDAKGRPLRMVGTLADITSRKDAQTELREAHDELEAHMRERTEAREHASMVLGNEVAERTAAEEHVRELLGQLVNAEEEERRRIARELHDTAGQHLTAINLTLKAIESEPGLPTALLPRLAQLQRATQELDADIDRLSHELRPANLDDLGLDDALRHHARGWSEESGIVLDIHTHGLRGRRFDPAVETTVYRVVQEALTNVRKHAHATRVSLVVEKRANQLRAIVEDDGRGFELQSALECPSGEPPGRRLGLRGMNERAALSGGRIEVETSLGAGATLYLTIPLPDKDHP
ncbi:PAS domain S-box protein [Piscinibacter sp. XHJ-5]|uniref:PAS domain S-box protein n=1 Tax=Piscinibacter sp. XHJ-5 TaxID=3037797 RepID=UPI0024535BEC|nr:PAS domain S-box protein [Piscinibacter sp. XHJ-5]